jgi:transcriptional regulator with XRE-family HTH domain
MPPDRVSRGRAVPGALGPRRAIGNVLRQLREERHKSLADVAADTLISRSKLSRLETAQGTPQLRDIRDLISYYEIDGTQQAARLRRWLAAARQPGWWTEFDFESLAENVDVHIAAEADAVVERAYALPFVPALLETDDYASAIFRDMEQRSEAEIGQLLRIRQLRKGVLTERAGLPPLKLIAVMHETALRQVVGSVSTMRDQLAELVNLSPQKHVQLYVLPFTAKPTFSMTCRYAHFEYQDPQVPDVVNIETHNGFIAVDDPSLVARYRVAHDELVAASLGEAESRALIASVRDDIYGR